MTRIWRLRATAALGVGLVFPTPAIASPIQDARKSIQAAYASMDKATSNRSASAYGAYLHHDCVGIDEMGVETDGKTKMVQALNQAFAEVDTATSSTKILTLALQDGGAIVTAHSALSFTGTKAGQTFVVKSDGQERDFWVKSGRRWLLKRERVLSAAKTLNGQKVP